MLDGELRVGSSGSAGTHRVSLTNRKRLSLLLNIPLLKYAHASAECIQCVCTASCLSHQSAAGFPLHADSRRARGRRDVSPTNTPFALPVRIYVRTFRALSDGWACCYDSVHVDRLCADGPCCGILAPTHSFRRLLSWGQHRRFHTNASDLKTALCRACHHGEVWAGAKPMCTLEGERRLVLTPGAWKRKHECADVFMHTSVVLHNLCESTQLPCFTTSTWVLLADSIFQGEVSGGREIFTKLQERSSGSFGTGQIG